MEREIKFRVWNKTENWYDTEFYIHADGYIYQDSRTRWDISDQAIESAYDELIIEQFTGLKDKNGKEIYEGDIVTHAKESNRTSKCTMIGCDEVIWDKHQAKFDLGKNDTSLGMIYKSYEIIGNIHQNPELLK